MESFIKERKIINSGTIDEEGTIIYSSDLMDGLWIAVKKSAILGGKSSPYGAFIERNQPSHKPIRLKNRSLIELLDGKGVEGDYGRNRIKVKNLAESVN